MRRLGGIDSAFLGMETPAIHAHVLAVSIYDPSPSPHAFDAEHAKALLLSKLDELPVLVRRLVEVPGGIALPYWIEDPDFDIDRHVTETRIARPGGREELAAAIGEIAGTQLDRDRPLWSWHVLTGLAGGRVAHVAKLHHAAVDGATGVKIMRTLNTPDPSVVALASPSRPVREPAPGAATVAGRVVSDLVREPRRLLRLQRDLLGSLPRMLRGSTGSSRSPRSGPRLSINRKITARRAVAFTGLEFDRARAVSTATGTTLNDVVLAVVAGALRTWLAHHDELPDRPLIAGVPVSTRELGVTDDVTNQVTAVLAPLPVQEADPRRRLAAVHDAMEEQKRAMRAAPMDLAEQAAGLVPPAVIRAASAAMEMTPLPNALPVPFNLGISNVPGSRERLYCTGAELLSHYGFAFVSHGAALNITMNSYVDRFDVALISCPDVVADLWSLADGLPDALEELAASVLH